MDIRRDVHDPPSIRGHFSSPLLFPARLFLSSLVTVFQALRPYAPQLVPVLVFILLIPVVILVSVFSGFLVWRSIAVAWHAPLHLQFGDGQPPYAIASLPKLIPQQRYDIYVRLTIPAVEPNYALGNFMTSLTITTPANQTLASVRQPAIVYPPKSSFFSGTPNTVTLTVSMLSSFHLSSPDALAHVEIGRRDSWGNRGNAGTRELSVITASVGGTVVHYGIRGLVARFPLTAAVTSTATFLTILSFMLSICVLPAALRSTSLVEPVTPKVEPVDERLQPSSPESEVDIKPLTRKRKSKLRLGARRAVPRTHVSSVSTSRAQESIRRRTSKAPDRTADVDSW